VSRLWQPASTIATKAIAAVRGMLRL